MSLKHTLIVAALGAAIASPAFATGQCPIRDAGPKADWQTKEALEKKLRQAIVVGQDDPPLRYFKERAEALLKEPKEKAHVRKSEQSS